VLKRAGEVNRTFQGPKMVIEHARPITGEHISSFPSRWWLDIVLTTFISSSTICSYTAGGGEGVEASP
jgi:hypothetical protein